MSVPALQEPAGLSSDTLEPPAPAHAIQDDQWSDVQTAETDDDRDIIEEVADRRDDLTIRPPKMSNDKTHDMNAPSPTLPTFPVVQVTEPTSPTPMTSRSASATYPSSPSSLAPTTSSLDRRTRNRATFDARASNRISGFFSNLIHRRDNPPAVNRDSPAPDTPPVDSSRASSPLPSRASTPPPALNAPSLNDLGLSLSCITSLLSPSHFSTPPSSGAFLQPHYLLLCHAQGLDVVPLVSPPSPQPYSLIRRVPFKSVVVMEHRGVLVAIAGRRDGVRVYALEEVKRAVEWRIELEVKREREKARREEMKKAVLSSYDPRERKTMPEKDSRSSKAPPIPPSTKSRSDRRATVSVGSPTTPVARAPSTRRPKTPPPPVPAGPPPAYTAPPRSRPNPAVPIDTSTSRSRATSVSDVLAGTLSRAS
ncbi:hypothetical protein NM688_g2975 [Phlebia brevispora]|uniref:Uncharacterized protein n=1 Tax=Phlebia brevispora TaxID=194682 RepID=A0ACC1T6Z3_9APHY|nr:hypothetical protein NM688_g2975 [Phlebia brevispora]